MQWIVYLLSAFGAVVGLCSAAIAYALYRTTARWYEADALFRVMERLETERKRGLKQTVYTLDRQNHGAWGEDILNKVDEWGADLDLVGVLALTGQLDIEAFFAMYGDVVIRSIYQLAPYINARRQARGRQFLLPFAYLSNRLLSVWGRKVKEFSFPEEIGLPGKPDLRLTHETFIQDEACRRFLHESGRLWNAGSPKPS